MTVVKTREKLQMDTRNAVENLTSFFLADGKRLLTPRRRSNSGNGVVPTTNAKILLIKEKFFD